LSTYSGAMLSGIPARPVSWVFEQPVTIAGRRLARRLIDDSAEFAGTVDIPWSGPDPWGENGDVVVDGLRRSGGSVVRLRGVDSLPAVQGRIDMAERIKLELGRSIIAQLPHSARGEAAAALVCGRCDLVQFT
ncbi:MAG: hypothetical protein ACRDTV_20675, partial [Mycobacterium sp.]